MKKLILLLLMSFTLMTNAQSTTKDVVDKTDKQITSLTDKVDKGVSTVYSDGKDAVKYLTPKAEKLLDKFGSKLETTSVKLWDILVRQQKVWSWVYLFGMILTLVSWFNFYRHFYKANTELEANGDWTTQNIFLGVALFSISITFTVLSVLHAIPMLTGFYNPEFGALQTIIEGAKTLK